MLVKTYGYAVFGIGALKITVEVNIGQGIGYVLLGLPDSAVKESQFRIETAMRNSGYEMPRQKVVMNMAPADIRKEGSAYDLTLAAGLLAVSGQMQIEALEESIVMGELGLDGNILPIKGALPIAIQAAKEGFKRLVLPKANAKEAAIVKGIEVYGIENLSELGAFFDGQLKLSREEADPRGDFERQQEEFEVDFSDVQGQENIKRALEIAAAGGHNIILVGPPGAGKTMLARRLPTILPPMTLYEALETTKIHSVAGKLGTHTTLLGQRPFRSPHHTVSDVALVGGGTHPQPGEISLAHNGVLFLDELPEFKRTVLEVLRQPLEERKVSISRSKFTVDYPAGFMLVASMNPCPCGYATHPEKKCICLPGAAEKYIGRVSGPLMDRIDLHIEVTPVGFDDLSLRRRGLESSKQIRERVIAAREMQIKRFENMEGVFCNAQMPSNKVSDICLIGETGRMLLKRSMENLKLSARAYDRILKVSRTIADLSGSEQIQIEHLAEAIQYRSLDRERG